jgi:hypothetical protein
MYVRIPRVTSPVKGIYFDVIRVRVRTTKDRKKGPPSRMAVVEQKNIETVHAPKHIQAAGALCMDRVAVLWSDPTAHRPGTRLHAILLAGDAAATLVPSAHKWPCVRRRVTSHCERDPCRGGWALVYHVCGGKGAGVDAGDGGRGRNSLGWTHLRGNGIVFLSINILTCPFLSSIRVSREIILE